MFLALRGREGVKLVFILILLLPLSQKMLNPGDQKQAHQAEQA